MQIDFYSHYVKLIKEHIILSDTKELAIFPLGKQGVLFKNILNNVFGIKEQYIIDNMLCQYREDVISDEELKKIDCNNLTVVLTATDESLNHRMEEKLVTINKNIRVINVLDPIVLHATGKEQYFREIKDLLRVKHVISDNKYIRVGRMNDGGYVMLDDFNKDMRAYSFGISDDISWDKEMVERCGLEVFMYDHTIKGLPEYNKNFHYLKMGISSEDDVEKHLLSMNSILTNNGDIDNKNLILKMDVEGAEYDFLCNTPSEIIDNFKQIVIEFHNITKMKNKEKLFESLNKLNETHQIVWIHGNNCDFSEIDDGIVVPNAVEALYLNRRYYEFEDKEVYFPWEIDQSNRYKLRDIQLGNWGKSDNVIS